MTEIVAILERFWQLRKLMVLAVLAGVVAALLTIFKVESSPPFLESRSSTRGVATTQILVDSRRSALTNVAYDISALQSRAQIFVQLVGTAEVAREIERGAGIPTSRLAVVPLVQRVAGVPSRDPSGGQRSEELTQELLGYRLEVQSAGDLPIIELRAQAPDAQSAARLANVAATATIAYLQRIGSLRQPPAPAGDTTAGDEAAPSLRAADRQAIAFGEVRFRQLGAATAGALTTGGGLAGGVLAGVVAFIVAALVLFFLAGLFGEVRRRREAAEPAVVESAGAAPPVAVGADMA